MGFTLPLVYILAPLFLTAQSTVGEIVPSEAAREEMARLSACLELIETDPEAAHDQALEWIYLEGNRRPARECRATALIALGYVEDGALQLEALANAPDGGSLEDRLHYLSRAGNAWLEIDMPENAITAFSNALQLDTEQTEIYTFRGFAHLQLENYERAETDLSAALSYNPDDFYAWLYRAQLRFKQERWDDALLDIGQARRIDPEDSQALLWRGHIREAKRLAAEGRSFDELPFR